MDEDIGNNLNRVEKKKLRKVIISPRDKLVEKLKNHLEKLNISLSEEHLNDLPKKWKIFDDLVLLPFNCFENSIWDLLGMEY